MFQIRPGRYPPLSGKKPLMFNEWTIMVKKGGTAETSVPSGWKIFL